jgi:hypothetical protein
LPIAAEQESTATVIAGRFGIDCEEVLSEEKVFMAIAIEISDGEAKDGSELGFEGEWGGLESISAIEEEHGIEGGGFESKERGNAGIENLMDTGLTVGSVGGERIGDERQRGGHCSPFAPWDPLLRIRIQIHLDEVEHAIVIEVAVVQAYGVFKDRLILGVASPVASHQIEPAIAREIARRHTIPPACMASQSPSFGDFPQGSLDELENTDGTPFAGEDQFGSSITIKVRKERGVHQTDRPEGFRPFGLNLELAMSLFEQERVRSAWITPGDASAADKEVELAVAIKIAKGEGAWTCCIR